MKLRPLLTACCLVAGAALPATERPAGPWLISAHGLRVLPEGVSGAMRGEVERVAQLHLALANDTAMTPPLADDLAYFLTLAYWQSGYRDAAVEWTIRDGAAVLAVREGQLFEVGAMTFEGADDNEEAVKEMQKYLLRPTHERSGTSTEHPPAIESDLSAGAGLVQRWLQSQGYLDATVSAPELNARDGVVDVTLRITKGRPYRFGGVTATGELLGRDEEIHRLLEPLAGAPFNEVDVETARGNIVGLYQERGYFAAKVGPQITPAGDGRVNVNFAVTPGERHRVTAVHVSPDLSQGAQRLATASFRPLIGKVYIPPNAKLTTRRVLETEMFTRLDVTPQAVDENSLALDISGVEGPRRRLGIYGGYQTFQGYVAGAEWRHANLWDSGDALRLKAELNGRGIDSGIKWVDPALFNSAFALDVDLSAQTFTFFDYDRHTLALRARLSRQWNAHITSSLFSEISLNEAQSEVLLPGELGPDSYRIVSLGSSVELDYRNSPVAPTDGWLLSATVNAAQDAGGSGVAFLRSEIAASLYQPLTKKLRVAFNARTAAIQTSDGAEALPIDLRLFNGGANSVRGFPEREMGLRSSSGTPLGGTLSHVFNAELSYQIINNLEFAVFADAGTLSRADDNPLAMPDDLRYAVGCGLRYTLPVGPLRIDYGYNPDRRVGEPSGALHITFGFAF